MRDSHHAVRLAALLVRLIVSAKGCMRLSKTSSPGPPSSTALTAFSTPASTPAFSCAALAPNVVRRYRWPTRLTSQGALSDGLYGCHAHFGSIRFVSSAIGKLQND